MHFFDFFEFSFYIICLYTGHFIIVKFCQKAEKINFIKFWPLIKSPGPFCHSSAEPKSQIFGNFSSNLRRTNLKSLWGRHGTLIVVLMYVCINPKMSPIRDPVRGRKNAPIDCCRYTRFINNHSGPPWTYHDQNWGVHGPSGPPFSGAPVYIHYTDPM